MATLNEVMKDTADAIREKTGKSELIAPVDFAEEIKSISVGGGESGDGGSSWRYWDISNSPAENKTDTIIRLAKMGASLMKEVWPTGKVFIYPTGVLLEGGEDLSTLTQIAWDENLTYTMLEDKLITLGEALVMAGLTPEMIAQMGFVEITEEQFYDLNA